MTGLKLHERTMTVQRASAELGMWLCDLQERHDLTSTEVAVILAGQQQSVLKYVLRAERHPEDPDRKADEA